MELSSRWRCPVVVQHWQLASGNDEVEYVSQSNSREKTVDATHGRYTALSGILESARTRAKTRCRSRSTR